MSCVFVPSRQSAAFRDTRRMMECLRAPDAYNVSCSEMKETVCCQFRRRFSVPARRDETGGPARSHLYGLDAAGR